MRQLRRQRDTRDPIFRHPITCIGAARNGNEAVFEIDGWGAPFFVIELDWSEPPRRSPLRGLLQRLRRRPKRTERAPMIRAIRSLAELERLFDPSRDMPHDLDDQPLPEGWTVVEGVVAARMVGQVRREQPATSVLRTGRFNVIGIAEPVKPDADHVLIRLLGPEPYYYVIRLTYGSGTPEEPWEVATVEDLVDYVERLRRQR
ncbi:hypothetical protein [Pelagovum pacificum]|uniref:Uncharacterized protein n=1 Tax=Pelagovum pacificum TaxID=2588711 RepID=A0A5C5GE58_9RHOB|nr:hypothetical protein [Pelagovum pacificum]QQA44400.1 hypothetical protein I8N54_07460 [Pelagovum pacificum]TNY32484.1 hypothetical protein FHY64_04120 [Pelagovum pacificum]